MTTSANSMSLSSHDSLQGSDVQETRKYILLRDTVAKARWSHGGTRLLSKRSEQRVLKGSLWQEADMFGAACPPPNRSYSRSSSVSSPHANLQYKQTVESLEIEDLSLQCASAFLDEISNETCRLLLAIPTSEERFYIHSDTLRMQHAQFINVGADVIVTKRNIPPCRATVKWKGRLVGKQGVWFGVQIIDEESKGTGDSDGSVNNIRLFTCEKNNGMFVNIAQLMLVPPKKPLRRPKKKAPSTPSQRSYNMTNGSQTSGDQYLNDLVSQTESELSFMDDVASAETVPLIDLQVNDRVAWPSDKGYEKALVRWIGTLPEDDSLHGEILVGVEFDNPIGKGTGVYKNKRLFEAKKGHASLVPVDGLLKISSSTSSLRNPSDSSSQLSLSNPTRTEGTSRSLHRQRTAADVLESIGIGDLEPSDLNNNSGGMSPEINDQAFPSPNEDLLSSQKPNLASADKSADQDVPNSAAKSIIPVNTLVNGSVAHSACSHSPTSSPHNHSLYDSPATRLSVNGDSVVQPLHTAGCNGPSTDTMNSALHSSGATNSHANSRLDDNSWSDSTSSLPEYATPSKVPQPVKCLPDKVAVLSRQMPKLHKFAKQNSFTRKKIARAKNGLVKMHHTPSLDVREMHDIVDELSLNSSINVSSIDSFSQNKLLEDSVRLQPSPEPQVAHSCSSEPLAEESNYAHEIAHDLSVKTSQSSETDRMTSPSSSEGSYSPQLESLWSAFPHRMPSSCLETDVDAGILGTPVCAVPAPFITSHSQDSADNADSGYCIIPDPPLEFMNDTTDVSLHVGLWKGIAGTVSPGSNANFVEAVLFLLSVSTDILCDTDQESSYPTLKSYLMEHITLPLRSGRFIDVDVMKKWRQELNEISTGQLLPVSSGREMQKFLTLLLQHICNLHPLHEFNNLKADYTMTLFAHKDARVGFPTVQKLLEKTCIQEKVKFNKVPDNLILILPRWSLGEEKIFPNLHIDLTDVLEYAKRVCHMCGDQAVFECPECYEQEHTDLSSAAFCQPCSQTIHKHSKRLKHMPVELKMVTQLGDEESSILILKGILSVQGSNYTTLSQPPRTSRNSLHNSTLPNWLSFNPRAATNDFTGTESVSHIPEVMLVESVPNWLSMDAYDCMAKDINTIPDNIRQLLHSCCMCVYSKS